jgi:tetratricopeptide (TPR) repeat protein
MMPARTTKTGARLLAVVCMMHVTSAASVARADETNATAEELFQQARALVDAGNYAEACPKLEQSQKLEPAVGTQFNLADCWEHVGRTASAHAMFLHVASIARAAGKFERERSARERANAIEPKLARVKLAVRATAPGLELRIDDAPIEKARWGEPFPIDPGHHVLRATAPGRTAWETRVTTAERSTAETTIPELIDPSPPPQPPPPPPPSSTQRNVALVTGGAGIVALGVGAVAGAVALSKRSTAESQCPSDTFHFRCPTEEGTAAWNSSTSAGDVSTIAFIAAGVLVAGAAVLWLTSPSARARAGASLSGIRIEGSF